MNANLVQHPTLREITRAIDRLPTDLFLKIKGDITPDVLFDVHRELRVRVMVRRLKACMTVTNYLMKFALIEKYLGNFPWGRAYEIEDYNLEYGKQYTVSITQSCTYPPHWIRLKTFSYTCRHGDVRELLRYIQRHHLIYMRLELEEIEINGKFLTLYYGFS